MKIIIDIPQEVYKCCLPYKDATVISNNCNYLPEMTCGIANGTPLPKGHGRLIDADAFISMLEDVTERQRYKELLIDDCLSVDDVIDAIIESLQNEGLAEGDAPTIIPAESEEEE